MLEVTFVTTNNGKYESAKHALRKHGITVLQEKISLPEAQNDSLGNIAISKAKYAYRLVSKPLLTMDAGFFIPSLRDFPGIFTHYVLDTIGVEGLLTLIKGKDTYAEFREALCFIENPDKEPQVFYKYVRGNLASEIRGELKPFHWSTLALVFIPHHDTKTMAEMSADEFDTFRKRVDKTSHWEQFARFTKKKG